MILDSDSDPIKNGIVICNTSSRDTGERDRSAVVADFPADDGVGPTRVSYGEMNLNTTEGAGGG